MGFRGLRSVVVLFCMDAVVVGVFAVVVNVREIEGREKREAKRCF